MPFHKEQIKKLRDLGVDERRLDSLEFRIEEVFKEIEGTCRLEEILPQYSQLSREINNFPVTEAEQGSPRSVLQVFEASSELADDLLKLTAEHIRECRPGAGER